MKVCLFSKLFSPDREKRDGFYAAPEDAKKATCTAKLNPGRKTKTSSELMKSEKFISNYK